MSPQDPERPVLDRDDARLVARLREGFAPEPLTPARRAAFDAALRARLERRPRTFSLPVLGTAFAAAALALVLVVRAAPPQAPEPLPAPRSAAAGAWIETILYADLASEEGALVEDDEEEIEALPAAYAAIASVLLR